MVWSLIQVAVGGALGSVTRFLTLAAFSSVKGAFPWGVFGVNVAGSFLMGALAVWLQARGEMRFAPLVLTGFLGGFTTFSAFSADVVRLLEGGAPLLAGGYAVASVVVSVLALIAGAALIRGLL